MQEDLITFDIEWLNLPKAEFKMLVMIADIGQNLGNASDMCRYFNRSPQNKNKNRLREALEKLAEQKIIDLEKQKNDYVVTLLKPILQENKVCLKRKYATEILHHNYTQSVAWENVLKVYIWLLDNGNKEFTNSKIEAELNVSESTITEAKNVLQDFGAVIIKHLTTRTAENVYRCYGQSAELSAFWIIT